MSNGVSVIAPPVGGPAAWAHERPGALIGAGASGLEQSVLSVPAAAVVDRATGRAEEALFVLEGSGRLSVGGEEHRVEQGCGVCLAPGRHYELIAGTEPLRVVRVRIPSPVHADEPAASPAGCAVRRLSEQPAGEATSDRHFRILTDPEAGLRSATQFVGEIPPIRAPEHFHDYDEVIYVLDGEGRFHAEGSTWPVAPGTCIGLPARVRHCLENTGGGLMRVLGVFRPAGSPAAAYYPDGTPAYIIPPAPRTAPAPSM